jgi:hypothetical protein
VNGLCPECGNPPEYHSFCTLCCQLFRPGRKRTRPVWGDPELRAEIAGLSADGLGAERIAKLMGLPAGKVKHVMTYYRLFAHPRGPRRARHKICEVA